MQWQIELASSTRVQHIAHGMLLPLLLCFPTGTAWELPAAPVPAQGTASVGEVLGSGISCCSQGAASARSKREQARVSWLSSTGQLCASSVASTPSLAEERGCCCSGKERVKGKVRCFGQGGKRLALTGVGERGVQCVPMGGRQQRGWGTCWLKGRLVLLLLLIPDTNKCRIGLRA